MDVNFYDFKFGNYYFYNPNLTIFAFLKNKNNTIFFIAQFWKKNPDGENSKYLNWHKFILILCGWWVKKIKWIKYEQIFLLTLVQLT